MAKRENQHFRNLPSRVFHAQELPKDFHQFYDDSVRGLVRFKGYKLEQKHGIAKHVIHNLIMAAFPDMGVVADSRDRTNTQAAARAPVWDAVAAAGLCEMCIGAENQRAVTRYRATSTLLELRQIWELRLVSEERFVRNTDAATPSWLAPVILHTGTSDEFGRPLADDQQRQLRPVPQVPYFQAVERIIERINRLNTSHAWQAFTVDPQTGREHVWEPSVRLRQIHVGEFFRATRLYTCDKFSAQNMSKEDRKKLLIDGEPVCELDYSCMALRLLYNSHRANPPGDLYYPERVFPIWYGFKNVRMERREAVRDFVKKVTNIALNVRSRTRAIGAVTNLLTDNPQEDLLRRVLSVDGLGVGSMLDRVVEEVHGDVSESFYQERGLKIMTTDGQIMFGILQWFLADRKPCLPIHDACVVKLSDLKYARHVMRQIYRHYIGVTPVIKRAF